MARFHYDLTGAEPIIRDVPVYDAANLDKGEFIMKAPTTTAACSFITGYAGNNTEMVNALGIMNETITTTSPAGFGDHVTTAATTSTPAISSIAATVATGNRYGKVIINPLAVYLAERDQSVLAGITAVACTASKTYTDTLEALVEGSWYFVTNLPLATSVVANRGQLRYVSVCTSTTSTTLLTDTTTTTAEKIIKILPVNHKLIKLSADAKMTSDLTAHTASDRIKLINVENYVTSPTRPLEPMRQQIHDGLQDSTLRFYSDLVMKDHIYNALA
jgi:hypothetical protein